MCTEEFIRMVFTVDLYGNRGLDSRSCIHDVAAAVLCSGCAVSIIVTTDVHGSNPWLS